MLLLPSSSSSSSLSLLSLMMIILLLLLSSLSSQPSPGFFFFTVFSVIIFIVDVCFLFFFFSCSVSFMISIILVSVVLLLLEIILRSLGLNGFCSSLCVVCIARKVPRSSYIYSATAVLGGGEVWDRFFFFLGASGCSRTKNRPGGTDARTFFTIILTICCFSVVVVMGWL